MRDARGSRRKSGALTGEAVLGCLGGLDGLWRLEDRYVDFTARNGETSFSLTWKGRHKTVRVRGKSVPVLEEIERNLREILPPQLLE